MRYWMTQSLLSSWRYIFKMDDGEAALASFLSTLRRERHAPSKAMLDGIAFEDAINAVVGGLEAPRVNQKWDAAVKRVAARCAGGQAQVPICGDMTVCGIDFRLYGICDYVKAGQIIDIKKPVRYEYGKYFDSPQHPMYMHLLPDAKVFRYLIFDGAHVYVETYRHGDFTPIEATVAEFVRWLHDMDLMQVYTKFWMVNKEREEKCYGIYKC